MHGVERAIAAIAGGQDNIIDWEQLLATGLGRGAIRHRVSAGSLQRVHRHVYLTGHAPPTLRGRARAAVLACGDGAVASHRTAAELWGLLPDARRDPEVTVAGRNPGVHPGIRIHRVAGIEAVEIRDLAGIALTSPARTICDIAATEPSPEVEHALQEARVHHRLADHQVRAVLAKAPTRRGTPLIKRLLADDRGQGYTRSNAERRMRSLLRRADLPPAEANVHFADYLLDFVWRRERLVVEMDGYGSHSDRVSFEADRRRDQVLVAAGFRVIRVTWRQLTEEPYGVIARVAQALAQSREAGASKT